jgi:predicted transcriptional regulator
MPPDRLDLPLLLRKRVDALARRMDLPDEIIVEEALKALTNKLDTETQPVR